VSRKPNELHPSWEITNVSKICDEMEAKRTIDEVNQGHMYYVRNVDELVMALVSRLAYLERMIDVLASRDTK
jgi:hypothetical protein